MKYGLAIVAFLALLCPLTSSAKQIKNYESELIVIYGDILATRNLTKEPNPDFIGWYIRITPSAALEINEAHFHLDNKMKEKMYFLEVVEFITEKEGDNDWLNLDGK